MEKLKSSKNTEVSPEDAAKVATGPVDPVKTKNPKSKRLKVIGLVVLALLLLAGTSYAGYKYAKSEDDESSSSSEKESTSETKDATPVEPEVATMVGPESGDYQVELPEDWVSGSCADNPDIYFLAPTTDLLGKCQTEYFGTVSISKIEGDQRKTEEYYAADDYYGSPAFSSVTIDSLPGYRVSYSIAAESELGYPPVGTFEYTYNLYDAVEDVTYKIGYRELESDTDYQAQFITIAESFDKL